MEDDSQTVDFDQIEMQDYEYDFSAKDMRAMLNSRKKELGRGLFPYISEELFEYSLHGLEAIEV